MCTICINLIICFSNYIHNILKIIHLLVSMFTSQIQWRQWIIMFQCFTQHKCSKISYIIIYSCHSVIMCSYNRRMTWKHKSRLIFSEVSVLLIFNPSLIIHSENRGHQKGELLIISFIQMFSQRHYCCKRTEVEWQQLFSLTQLMQRRKKRHQQTQHY